MTNQQNKDGGPAFPLAPEVGKAHFDNPMAYPGMTLRDWFAGQALIGYLAMHADPDSVCPADVKAARRAYEFME